MPPRPLIDEHELGERARDYGLNTLSQVSSLIMGAVFATAALAFADILRSPDDREIRLVIWIAGVLNCSLALMRFLHSSLLHTRPSAAHLPLILAFGFLATINFALNSLAMGGQDGWRWVYLFAALLMPIAAFLTHAENRPERLTDFAPRLRPMIERRQAEGREALTVVWPAMAVNLAAFAMAWAAREEPWPWIAILLAVNAVGLLSVVWVIWREIASFRRFIDGIEQARRASDGDV